MSAAGPSQSANSAPRGAAQRREPQAWGDHVRLRIMASAVAVFACCFAATAQAQDTLKLAIGQRGNWDTSIAEIGTRAGIFKKHGLVLENLYTQGGGETQQAVISGSVDVGVAAGVMGVLSAFSKGAPVRVIGAETT